jgi:dihydrofolate reductase
MLYGAGSGVTKLIAEARGFLLGRRTYEIFAGYWPNAPAAQEIADSLNTKPKHVASRTLTGALEWQNSSVLPGGSPRRGCCT